MKRPAFQFYPGDWRKDVELRSCTIAARGMWIDLLCVMHECEPYGHLILNGNPMTNAQIAGQIGLTAAQVKKLIDELVTNGVARKNEQGVIFSKRMVDDERVRNARAEGGKAGAEHGTKGAEFGKLGGAPGKTTEYHEPGYLYAVQKAQGGPIKVGVTKYIKQRFYALRKEFGEIVVLCSVRVTDMADTETATHQHFNGRREGEWITAPWPEVMQVIWGGNHPPLDPPPSSSSSSSTADQTTPIPPKGAKRSSIALKTFLADCKAKGEKPIPEDDPVFDYAQKAGIPDEFLRLQWREFVDRYRAPDAKRYKDWRAVFRKAVRGNWFRLWYVDPAGQYALTTQGIQAQKTHNSKAA